MLGSSMLGIKTFVNNMVNFQVVMHLNQVDIAFSM